MKTHIHTHTPSGDGEMVLWLGEHAALTEDLGLAPSTCMVSYNHLYLQFQGIGPMVFFWPPRAHSEHTYTHADKTLITIK